MGDQYGPLRSIISVSRVRQSPLCEDPEKAFQESGNLMNTIARSSKSYLGPLVGDALHDFPGAGSMKLSNDDHCDLQTPKT